MLWFSTMLMPTGSPAMELITMVSDAGVEDERRIAGILAISYVVSPVMVFVVVGALRASQAAVWRDGWSREWVEDGWVKNEGS
jgi:hypothetical protein